MAYAYDIMHGEDWGNGPVYQSGYNYPTPLAALDAALDILDGHGWREDDKLAELTGIYVYGEEVDPADPWETTAQWVWTPNVPGVTLAAMDGVAEDI